MGIKHCTTDSDTISIEEFTPDKNGNFIRLLKPIVLNVDTNKKRLSIFIPTGTLSDAASIPSIAWSIIKLYPTHPKILLAAVVHDALYRDPNIELTRRECDQVLKALCKCSKLQKFLIYNAVRLFGSKNYKPRKIT